MTYRYHLAIDIGASSGRHILGHLEDGRIVLEEIYRFDNSQIRKDGHDCWDHEALTRHVVAGLKACAAAGKIPATVGIDTWGVDFILLDESLQPCSDMVAYRDARTNGMDAEVEKILPFAEHYARTGIQKAIFNTVYQMAGLKREHPEQLEKAAHFLMVPDPRSSTRRRRRGTTKCWRAWACRGASSASCPCRARCWAVCSLRCATRSASTRR